ncbi:MAG TPA: 16S rRNA (cytosine(1402)-N(4))-methyltransferase RsmH [Abditibacteriaceae bacterium]|nr:16S rRNA (cytosine(1402)-N(4))-methyltransferase RsmH [Abditibacteriaceae bacterium]
MVNEVLEYLRCRSLVAEDAVFLDATLGTAGHTLAILEAHPTCRVVAFDRDSESMEFARSRLEAAGAAARVTLVQGNFRNAVELLQPFFENLKVGADGRPITRIDGALIDAGMSLFQVTWPERGFSFRAPGPLDMRYGRDGEESLSAFDLVNRLSATELEDLLFKFSDERWARRIATVIADHRRSHVIRSTAELASLVEAAIPVGVRRQSRVHPATKTFAALRLAVNDEFWSLDHGAWALSSVLAPAARLVVLTYSSHEDRIVKRTFRRLAGRAVEEAGNSDLNRTHRKRKRDALSPGRHASGTTRSPLTFSLALPTDEHSSEPAERATPPAAGFGQTWGMKIVTNKPLVPTPAEIAANPLARSCKLRALEKFAIQSRSP